MREGNSPDTHIAATTPEVEAAARMVPFQVIADECRALGVEADQASLVLGVVIGRFAPEALLDEEQLRFFTRHTCGAKS